MKIINHPKCETPPFDHEAVEIWLRWWEDDVPFSEWLLSHELAHAYQFAARPAAYLEEPSWIHEGWAEHAVATRLTAQDAEAARGYLRRQAESFLHNGVAFDSGHAAHRHVLTSRCTFWPSATARRR